MTRATDTTFSVERARAPMLDEILGHAFPVLDHGHIRVVDYMGNDESIVQMARVSYGEGTTTRMNDRTLIRYLMRHRHTSPFEGCEIKLHVKLPIFVARQWIRSRMANVNEVSARYSILASEFHLPDPEHLAQQSQSNKQGREGGYDASEALSIISEMDGVYRKAAAVYEDLLDGDGTNLARETAREVLPLSTYTEWYWKIDLHNLLHFLQLRADPHAQLEIRKYAEVIKSILAAWVPLTAEAANDYRFGAVTFSRMEIAALRRILAAGNMVGEVVGFGENMSDRELTEFRQKLGG